MRITLNVILRAVFGADGAQLDELRRIIPPWVTLGSRLAVLPMPSRTYGRFSPWGRLAQYRRDYDDVIGRLIDAVQADPNLRHPRRRAGAAAAQHLRGRLDDVAPGHRRRTADAAGRRPRDHRRRPWAGRSSGSRRHPEVLARLVAEADTDGNEYRQADASSRCSAPAPSSTSRAGTCTRRPSNSATG